MYKMETVKCTMLIFCTLFGHGLSRPSTTERCSSPADIVFILDSSTSIWIKHFRQQTAFVSDVINNFDIGPGTSQTRVGVLTFGHQVWKKFDLNSIFDKQKMIQTVKDIEHGEGRRTNTGDAIKYAATRMFTPETGNRAGVPRVAIVITDGRSQDTLDTQLAARKAHDSGITMFAIGVGSNLDFNELTEIASEPASEYRFLVNDFTALSGITDKLTKKTCEATKAPLTTTTPLSTTTTTTTPETTTTTPVTTTTTQVTTTTAESKPADQSEKDCGGKPAEVIFVLDASSSIAHKDFNTEIDFVKNVVNMFDIGPNKTRVGIIRFSHSADLILGLDNKLTKEELISSILAISHVGGGTNSADALNLLRQRGFGKTVVRRNVPRVAVFLTDGLSADEERTARAARLTHEAGVKVFSIGIGGGVDLVEIKRIASDPDNEFVFQVDDFNSLDTIKEMLAVRTCRVEPTEIKDEPIVTPACSVRRNTDLMFIYDITALGEEKSRAISAFLSSTVSQLDLTSRYLHVGRITDNCPTDGNFQLSSQITSADFSSIRLSSFSHLLQKVYRSGFTAEYGGRTDSNNVAVVFLDAEMDTLDEQALHAVNKLTKKAEVFVVAMGHSHTIHKLTKTFNTDNIIHLDSYRDLDGAMIKLLGKLCHYFQTRGTDYDYDIAPFVPV